MSLKTRFFSILTVAISVVAFSTLAIAQETKATTPQEGVQKRQKLDRKGKMHDGMRKEMRGGKFGRAGGGFHGLRGVELTDAQKEQIRVIRESNKPDEATMKEFRAIREARKAGTAITPEQKERMKALRDQSRAKAGSVHQQILGVLTADQKAQIEQRKQEMKTRREQFRQKREEFRKTRPAKPAAAAPEKTKIT